MWGDWPELAAVAHPVPARCRAWGAEAIVAGRGGTEGNATPRAHRPGANGAIGAQILFNNTAYPTRGGAHRQLICQGVSSFLVGAAGAFVRLLDKSGEFTFTWHDDDGSTYEEKQSIEVA